MCECVCQSVCMIFFPLSFYYFFFRSWGDCFFFWRKENVQHWKQKKKELSSHSLLICHGWVSGGRTDRPPGLSPESHSYQMGTHVDTKWCLSGWNLCLISVDESWMKSTYAAWKWSIRGDSERYIPFVYLWKSLWRLPQISQSNMSKSHEKRSGIIYNSFKSKRMIVINFYSMNNVYPILRLLERCDFYG